MTVVKSIDVALRAQTTEWDSGFSRGKKVLNDFDANYERVTARLQKATTLFNTGGIAVDDYSKTIRECDGELKAMEAGFSSMGAATQRAQAVLKGMETDTDRYNAKLKELDALEKLTVLTKGQHAAAVAKVTAEYKASQPAIQQAQTAFQKITSTIGPFIAAGGAAAIAYRGMTMATNSARRAIDSVVQSFERVDQAHAAAKAIGIATGELMKLRFAIGEVAGISEEGVDAALKKMNFEIANAAATGKGATQVIEQLGLKVADLAAMTPDKAFNTLADAISNVQGVGDRTVATMAVFGKEGKNLHVVFQDNAAALKESAMWAQQAGFNISQIKAESIDAANDAIGRLKTLLTGASQQIAGELAPQITALANTVIQLMDSSSNAVEGLSSKFDSLGKKIAMITDVADFFFSNQAQKGAQFAIDQSKKGGGVGSLLTNTAGIGAKVGSGIASGDIPTATSIYMQEYEKAKKQAQDAAAAATQNSIGGGLNLSKTTGQADKQINKPQAPAQVANPRFQVVPPQAPASPVTNYQGGMPANLPQMNAQAVQSFNNAQAQKFQAALQAIKDRQNFPTIDQAANQYWKQQDVMKNMASPQTQIASQPATIDKRQTPMANHRETGEQQKVAKEQLAVEKRIESHMAQMSRRGIVLKPAVL